MFFEEYLDDLIEELFDGEDWSVILNNKYDLEFYLIYSGDF